MLMTKVRLFSDGKPYRSYIEGSLKTFERKSAEEAKPEDIIWAYFLWLVKQVGLNGPDKNQEWRKKETDDQTYFMLADILFRTEFKPKIDNDKNRVEDAKIIREDFALLCSRYRNYAAIDSPGVSFLEVMIALCHKFDSDVMMTEDGKDRAKDWFWLMLKNAGLDEYVDSKFSNMDDEDNPYIICESILKIINDREYGEDGKGGFFPLKHPKTNQKNREIWYQMHEYFLENLID